MTDTSCHKYSHNYLFYHELTKARRLSKRGPINNNENILVYDFELFISHLEPLITSKSHLGSVIKSFARGKKTWYSSDPSKSIFEEGFIGS